MATSTAWVTAVRDDVLVTHLMEPLSGGETVFEVDAVGGFEIGGKITIGTATCVVADLDLDEQTLTLDASTPAPAAEDGDPVVGLTAGDVANTERVADMSFNGGGDVEALVPTTLVPFMPLGDYVDPVPVEVELVDRRWRILRLVGVPAVIDDAALGIQPTVQFADDVSWPDRKGWAIDPTTGDRYSTRAAGGFGLLDRWTSEGAKVATYAVTAASPNTVQDVFGVTSDGTDMYVLFRTIDNVWRVQRFFTSDHSFRSGGDVRFVEWTGADGARRPALGYDHTSGKFLVAQSRASDDKVRIRRHTFTATSGSAGTFTGDGTWVTTAQVRKAQLTHVDYDSGSGLYYFAGAAGNALVRAVDAAGTEVAGQSWSSGAEAGLLGIAHDDDSEAHTMDVSGLERRGHARRGSEIERPQDLRMTVTLTATTGVATVAHNRGVAPTGVVPSSNDNARRVTWSQGNTTTDVIGFVVRTNTDDSLYSGSTGLSFIAWWD